MCNLYKVPLPEPVAEAFRLRLLPGYAFDSTKPVGPLGRGLFLQSIDGALSPVEGQWGIIPSNSSTRVPMTRPRDGKRPARMSTNNARLEGLAKSWTFGGSWRCGRRCLIPAEWYAEPNWETGRNIWWHLRRADSLPWALAGLWSEWTDPQTGELVPNYTMITRNCDDHPLLKRLHKPDPKLPAEQQDKRSLVHVEPDLWDQWLHGTEEQAREVLARLPAPDVFDPSDRDLTDQLLAQRGGDQPVLL